MRTIELNDEELEFLMRVIKRAIELVEMTQKSHHFQMQYSLDWLKDREKSSQLLQKLKGD